MGIFSYFVGKAITETAVDVSNSAARMANSAAGSVTSGFESFANRTRDLSLYLLGDKTDNRKETLANARRQQEARKLGLPTTIPLTAEQVRDLKKLKEFKDEIRAILAELRDEIEDLDHSLFKFATHKKKYIKEKKETELKQLCNAPTLQALKEQAAIGIKNEGVALGWHSRTRDVLQKILNDSASDPALQPSGLAKPAKK